MFVLDDNEDFRNFISALLVENYRILIAEDGKEALQVILDKMFGPLTAAKNESIGEWVVSRNPKLFKPYNLQTFQTELILLYVQRGFSEGSEGGSRGFLGPRPRQPPGKALATPWQPKANSKQFQTEFNGFVFEKRLQLHAVSLPSQKSGYDFHLLNCWLEGVVLGVEKNEFTL